MTRTLLLLLSLVVVLGGCGKNSISGHPDEDAYTIVLASFNKAADAEVYRQATEGALGWKDLSVKPTYNPVAGKTFYELSKGRYLSEEQCKPFIVKAREWKGFESNIPYPFRHVRMARIPGKDLGPPEWNLRNIPPEKAKYTVIVAAFHDEPANDYVGRRKFAAEACKVMREQGEEAYFYHGLTDSVVTIGLFGPTAIKVVYENAGTVRRQVPNDPRMVGVIRKHPALAENGRKVTLWVATLPTPQHPKGKPQLIDKPSYVWEIERDVKPPETTYDLSGNPQPR